MFDLYFSIRNPFRSKSDATPHDYVVCDWKVMENKSIELQISKFSQALDLLNIRFGTNFTGEDHAGPNLEITVWKFFFAVKLYDHRHWDYDANDWESETAETAENREFYARQAYESYVLRRATDFDDLPTEERQQWLEGRLPE